MTQPDPIARVIEQYAIENANMRITISQLQAQIDELRAVKEATDGDHEDDGHAQSD